MSGILNETRLSPGDVRRLPLLMKDGRPISPSTFWRWVTRGVRAVDGERVKLETIIIPGTGRISSKEAVERFMRRLNGDDGTAIAPAGAEGDPDAAEAELAAAGFRTR